METKNTFPLLPSSHCNSLQADNAQGATANDHSNHGINQ